MHAVAFPNSVSDLAFVPYVPNGKKKGLLGWACAESVPTSCTPRIKSGSDLVQALCSAEEAVVGFRLVCADVCTVFFSKNIAIPKSTG